MFQCPSFVLFCDVDASGFTHDVGEGYVSLFHECIFIFLIHNLNIGALISVQRIAVMSG